MNHSTRSGEVHTTQPTRENFARFNETICLTVSHLADEFLPKDQCLDRVAVWRAARRLPRDGRGNRCTAIFADFKDELDGHNEAIYIHCTTTDDSTGVNPPSFKLENSGEASEILFMIVADDSQYWCDDTSWYPSNPSLSG